MSTKSSIAYGEGFHLYHELMTRSDDVYLRLDRADFEASPDQVIVRIPIAVWEHIRKFAGFTPQYHELTDEELRALVEREVEERIQEWRSAPKRSKGLVAFFGSAVYGSAADPREQQVSTGLQHLTDLRAEERKIVQSIKAFDDYMKRREAETEG